MNSSASFDPEELLHLALSASEQHKHEEAISLLKRTLEGDPKNPKAHYLLGAVYAQIGLFDRAVTEMAAALDLDPSLDAARFQLGLLYISSGRPEEAKQTWRQLDELGSEHPLFLFKTGLLLLAEDRFEDCIEALQKGIALNRVHESLNRDMEKIVSAAQEALDNQDSIGDQSGESEATARHVLLSSYEQDDSDK